MREVYVPLKIIWLGEYACLYDKKAIGQTLAGLSLGVKPDASAPKLEDNVAEFVERYFDLLELEFVGFKRSDVMPFRVETTGLFGIGLGTSAALAVALSEYVYPYLKRNWQSRIPEIIAKIENSQHGKASGVDQFLVCQDPGVYAFQVGSGVKVSDGFPFPFLVVNTFGESSTSSGVASVAQFYDRNRSKGFSIMRKLGHGSYNLLKSLAKADYDLIYEDLIEAQDLLFELGVVHEKVQEFSRYMRSFKVVAKVTGAGGNNGGSGAMLITYEDPETYSLVRGMLEKYGYELIYKAVKTDYGYV